MDGLPKILEDAVRSIRARDYAGLSMAMYLFRRHWAGPVPNLSEAIAYEPDEGARKLLEAVFLERNRVPRDEQAVEKALEEIKIAMQNNPERGTRRRKLTKTFPREGEALVRLTVEFDDPHEASSDALSWRETYAANIETVEPLAPPHSLAKALREAVSFLQWRKASDTTALSHKFRTRKSQLERQLEEAYERLM